jgi:hypothetical protein
MTHPDQSEQQLRRALSTMNDLQPPVDELFVQRAIIRGRARTSHRRSVVIGAAAALVVVAGGGGILMLQDRLPVPASSSAGSAAGGPYRDNGASAEVKAGQGAQTPGVPVAPAMGDAGWFVGPMTPQRSAIESLVPELTTAWAATFSGAFANDQGNTSIVVALTHRDAALEALVRAAMPAPTDVDFVVARHSYADKAALVDRIWGDAAVLRGQGIVISSVAEDFRADRVVVAAAGADVIATLTDRYGADWVTVTALR